MPSADFMPSSLNVVDFAVLGLMILSIFIGLLRGFTRELFGTMGWIGAILFTFWAKDYVQGTMRHWVGNALFADLITIVVIFILSLFLFLSITRALSLRVKASVLGGLDRSLGVVFGIARGAVICVIAFLLANLFYKPYRRPPELIHARTFPYLLKSTESFSHLFPKGTIPPSFYHPNPSAKKGEDQPIITDPTAQELMKSLAKPKTTASKEEQSAGYADQNRRHMDRLFKNYSKENE